MTVEAVVTLRLPLRGVQPEDDPTDRLRAATQLVDALLPPEHLPNGASVAEVRTEIVDTEPERAAA